MALVLAFVALDAFTAVQATLYVIQPSAGSTCSGGSPCTVQWLDDGTTPLNSNIGVTTCGLYTGDMQLVQTIDPVDVSSTQSLVFTPLSDAGPDSSDYYIAFTSTDLEINGTKYTSYSPLNNMTGSFSSSVASATSSIPFPSSLTESSAFSETGILSTVTVGTITPSSSSTASSLSETATIPSSSKFSISRSSSATSSSSVSASSGASASTSTASGATSSNGAASLRTASLTFFGVLSFTLILFL
ncbi:hypothetical protein C8R41DRAFT_918989 [Lentinula lateritia]|uniref:Yeast cell wall synthesis Kre9/Knh1-like N-terminal domain-containing protein n=1 Tax=Lentinula lateritia TaxID=40482 RepID=A0ABQ8VI02_9AGAR|nr:hypothetical protein C8R41DRAFT_918989 [Lentinula lateritia]